MNTDQSSGHQANKSGAASEGQVAAAFQDLGYWVQTQVPVGESIYPGKYLRADVLVRGLAEYPAGLYIEVKTQDRPGSVDEKFPYLFANIHRYPAPVLIVLFGDGFHPGAVKWLTDRATVMNERGFFRYIRSLPAAPPGAPPSGPGD